MNEPEWIEYDVVVAIHEAQSIAEEAVASWLKQV
jgi:hypothetical protein